MSASDTPTPAPDEEKKPVYTPMSIEDAKEYLRRRQQETCFGLPWEEIQKKQGGRIIR